MNAAKALEERLSDPRSRAIFCRAFVKQFPAFAFTMIPGGRAAGSRDASAEQRTDHLRLWAMIDASGVVFSRPLDGDLFPTPAQWSGTATELLARLHAPESKLSPGDKAELKPGNWVGMQLMELHRQFGSGVVAYRRSGDARRWLLRKE